MSIKEQEPALLPAPAPATLLPAFPAAALGILLGAQGRPLLRLLPLPAPWNPLSIGFKIFSGQSGNRTLKNAGVPEPGSLGTWLFSGMPRTGLSNFA